MDYHPFDRGAPFYAYYKNIGIEVVTMSKIAFTGGGTVGHVSVNESYSYCCGKGHEAFYIGSKQGIEREMIESQLPDIKYYPISSGKLRRYLSFENAKDVFKVLKGVLDARKILKKHKPDLLFSKGGFVSVPVVIAARSLKIPTIIHESDLTPGLANKIALKFAKKFIRHLKIHFNIFLKTKLTLLAQPFVRI